MIPIWLAVIIAIVSSWIGFFTCALLTINRDTPSDRYLNIKDKSAELRWTDEVDDVVHRKDMEVEDE